MGAPAEILEEIFTVIEGGQTIGQSAEIIQFPADNGARTFPAINKFFQGSNGTGLNYWVAAVSQGASAVSAGALMITVSIPEFIAFAVPCLGIAVGTAWYNIAPDLWDNVGEAIVNAGWTINGKVVAFMTDNGIITFPPEAIELLKDELVAEGAFEHGAQLPEYEPAPTTGIRVESNVSVRDMFYYGLSKIPNMVTFTSEAKAQLSSILLAYNDYTSIIQTDGYPGHASPSYGAMMQINPPEEYVSTSRPPVSYTIEIGRRFVDGITEIVSVNISGPNSYLGRFTEYFQGEYTDDNYICASSVNGTAIENNNLQQGGIYPAEGVPFRTTYPDWLPWEFPDIPGWQIPQVMPVAYPDLLPVETEPYQEPAQNPEGDDDTADEGVKKLEDPKTNPEISNAPEVPDPDPETGDEGADIDNPADEESAPDPIEPDPPVPITPVIPVTPLPDSVHSNKLFTVYNPSSSQLGQLGGYLWDDDLIDILRKIWQNPLDGIISLIQVYATPVTGGNSNIILGYLDSGVSAPVVTNQFATIDCGSITINEQSENCLDYIPYTKLELYLPFIGVTEIDTNEFMAGTINVKYKIDVYTGTCLAEVKCTRNRDLANGTILYTFNGNCSQQIPLTSGDARGVLGALIGAAGLGLSIASGGAAAVTGAGLLQSGARVAGGLASMTSQEMLHVGHSGNLSANAGIMGQKKPYLIINRKRAYNANSYNRYYGFPANKTVNPGNHSGFLRLKAGRLQSAATEQEKAEIYELLTHGVIM